VLERKRVHDRSAEESHCGKRVFLTRVGGSKKMEGGKKVRGRRTHRRAAPFHFENRYLGGTLEEKGPALGN